MPNKVAISFGVILAIFITIALFALLISLFRERRKDVGAHNRQHHTRLDNWIAGRAARERGNDDEERGGSIELPLLPPPRAHTRKQRRASRFEVGRTFVDVPLSPVVVRGGR